MMRFLRILSVFGFGLFLCGQGLSIGLGTAISEEAFQSLVLVALAILLLNTEAD